MSKIHTEIYISILHYDYVVLTYHIRDSLLLNSIAKKVIDNLGIDSKNLEFLSIYSVYGNNNGAIVAETSPSNKTN